MEHYRNREDFLSIFVPLEWDDAPFYSKFMSIKLEQAEKEKFKITNKLLDITEIINSIIFFKKEYIDCIRKYNIKTSKLKKEL